MAIELTIPAGTKMQMAFDVPIGKMPEFNMISTFFKAVDSSSFLISIPIYEGKPMLFDENQKFLFRYSVSGENMILAAYPDDLVKEGIRRYWKMRRVNEMRQFFQRKDERIKVSLHASYTQPTWPINDDGTITAEDAMTLDISAGGAALFLNNHYDVGEVIELVLPRVGLDPEGAAVENIIAAICWTREAPKGSLYRFIAGVQFRMASDLQREQLANYTLYIKKKFNL